jgi:hypothetical protein
MRKGGANAPPHYAVLEIRRILMKRRLFPLAAVALLLCMLFFIFSPSTAHADALDPYDSGCANTGYVANSGTLSVAGYVVYAENWYSTGCNTNWAEIWWNGGSAVQTGVAIYGSSGTRCYPTSCGFYTGASGGYYTGGLSPSWTDMINGTEVTYVLLCIKADGQTTCSPNPWLPA